MADAATGLSEFNPDSSLLKRTVLSFSDNFLPDPLKKLLSWHSLTP